MKNIFLIERRKSLNLSQQKVASKVGIDRSYYSKIENGLTPSVKVAQEIAKHLDLDWTIFFERSCVKNAQTKTAI